MGCKWCRSDCFWRKFKPEWRRYVFMARTCAAKCHSTLSSGAGSPRKIAPAPNLQTPAPNNQTPAPHSVYTTPAHTPYVHKNGHTSHSACTYTQRCPAESGTIAKTMTPKWLNHNKIQESPPAKSRRRFQENTECQLVKCHGYSATQRTEAPRERAGSLLANESLS